MTKCSKCDYEYYGHTCPNCGAEERNGQTAAPVPQSSAAPYKAGGNISADNRHITTPLEWFGWVLLTILLPVAGVIIMLFCAPDKSAKNYAKLHLITYIVAVVFLIAMLVLAVFYPAFRGYMRRR